MSRNRMFRKYLVAAIGFVLVIGTMGVGSTHTSNALSQKSEKIKEVPKLGVFAIPDAPGEKNEHITGVICKTLTGCQFPDPRMGFNCAREPAIRFSVAEDQVVHVEADIFDGLDCLKFVFTAVGDLPLGAGAVTIFLAFTEPLPPGTQLSIRWRIGDCPETKCVNYTLGSSDQPLVCSQL